MNTRQTTELRELADRLMGLTPDYRLVVAAALLEQGKDELAETIAGAVVEELRARRLGRRHSATGRTH